MSTVIRYLDGGGVDVASSQDNSRYVSIWRRDGWCVWDRWTETVRDFCGGDGLRCRDLTDQRNRERGE